MRFMGVVFAGSGFPGIGAAVIRRKGCCYLESSAEGRIRPRAFYAKCLIPLGVSAHSTEFLSPLDIPHRGEPEAFAKPFSGGSWPVWRSGRLVASRVHGDRCVRCEVYCQLLGAVWQ